MSTYAVAGKKRYRSSRSRRYKGRRRYRKTGTRLVIGWPRYKRGPNSRWYRKSIRSPGNAAAELKYWDTAASAQTLVPGSVAGPGSGLFSSGWAGGYRGCFNAVSVGDSYYNRDGNQIRMKYLHVKGQINWEGPPNNVPVNAAPGLAGAYLALVLDTQPNTVACPSEQIFSNPTNAAGGQEGNSFPQINALARKRFRILKDQRFVVSNRNFVGIQGNPFTGQYGVTTAQFEWFIPLNMLSVEYVGETGSISTIQKNALNLYGWGYDTTPYGGTTMGQHNSVKFSTNSRLRFYG